ncbi:hypothetical protein BD779DRAFT_260420 [Infundibulicybe gibba]|nr:hypothetical protein BD779DRAFT_260420 [Infundibulicybe gibba]
MGYHLPPTSMLSNSPPSPHTTNTKSPTFDAPPCAFIYSSIRYDPWTTILAPSPDAPLEQHQTIFHAMKQRDGSSRGPRFDLDYPAAASRTSSVCTMPRSRLCATHSTVW